MESNTKVDNRPAVLVVDDEKEICTLVCEVLAEQDYLCNAAPNADDALSKIKKQRFDVALLDIKLPGTSGMELLKAIKKNYPTIVCIMMTAVNDLNIAVEAMKLGASDYILKPFTFDQINTSISTVLENRSSHCTVNKVVPSKEDVDYNDDPDSRSINRLNAIAYGVDARIDHFDFHSKIVTEKTVELARWLGLPEKEIGKWVIERTELYNERDRKIESILGKLERNPMARVILGLTRSVYYFLRFGEQN